MTLQKFPPVELGVKELLDRWYPDVRKGGDLSYDGPMPYLWISEVSGAGRITRHEGLWYVDIDVLTDGYLSGMDMAADIEAHLLDGAHRTSRFIFDVVGQSSPPSEIPWRDDAYYRINATYSFRARRVRPIS